MESSPSMGPVWSPKNRFWFVSIWVALAGVVIPPLFGLLGTVFGMVGAFDELGRTGESDPEALAQHISTSLVATAMGLVVSLASFGFLIVAIVRFIQTRRVE